ARKRANPRESEYSLARPDLRMLILSRYRRLDIDIRAKIRHQEIVIVVDQRVANPPEQPGLAGTKAIGRQLIEHPLEARVSLVIGARLVSTVQREFLDLIGGQAKDEYIFRADGFANLDIRAVESPHRQCAVHRELHVAGAGCFAA